MSKISKATFLGFLFLGVLTLAAAAQEDVKAYLLATDPYLAKIQSHIKDFVAQIKPQKESRDIVGMKTTTDNFVTIWTGLGEELAQLQVPEGAKDYHESLLRLIDLQRQSNQLLGEVLQDRIALALEVNKMREAGSSDEDVQEFIKANSASTEFVEKATAVRELTKETDLFLKAERARLVGEVKDS